MLTIRKNLKTYLYSMTNALKIDDSGAFVLPFELRLKDQEFLKYCHLDVDWNMPPYQVKICPMNSVKKQLS